MTTEKTAANSLDSFWKYYESGEFNTGVKTLSEFGISSDVINFTFNPDSYYIPNKRGDDFVRPHRVSEDLIPVIGLDDARTHRFDLSTVHALQSVALRNAGIDPLLIDKEFTKMGDAISSSGGRPGTASIFTRRLSIDKPNAIVESGPTVLLNMEREQTGYSNTCAGVILHELVHVAQCLNEPVLSSRDSLQKELEAYAVQACLVDSYAVPYSNGTILAGEVNIFRKRHLGEKTYKPTNEFRADLLQNDMLKKIVKD